MENESKKTGQWEEPQSWYRDGLGNHAKLPPSWQEKLHKEKIELEQSRRLKFLSFISTWLRQLGRK